MRFKLEKRAEPSRFMLYATPFGSVLVTMIVGAIIFSIIGSLQLFDLVYIIWGQYVSGTAGTSTMAIYMVAQGRDAGNYGYGSAVAVVMFLISLAVALLYQRFVLRRDLRGAVTEGVV